MWEYAIIPISFEDYSEYVEQLDICGKQGYKVGVLIRTYKNSPIKGVTTHDFICRRNRLLGKVLDIFF